MGKTKNPDLALLRSARRKAHFANGGTLTEWRGGNATRIANKKREASRKACRNTREED